VPKERRETVNGPYERKNRWRLVITAANNRRCTESFESEAAALERKASYQREIEQRTIAAAVEAYLATEERRMNEGELRPSTLERVRYHLRSTLRLETQGHHDLRKLTPAYAEQLYDARHGAVDTHRNGLSVAKSFGAWCVKHGWLRENPFVGVKGRGRRKRGKPQLRIDEARVFQQTCLELAPRDDGAVLSLAYLLLGARAGEVVLRQVRDVDDRGRLLWIPDSKTEAGRRQVGVPAQLASHLERLAHGRVPAAALFAHASTRARAQDWAREQVARLCKLAKVPRVTPQGLRGTLATMGREVGNTSQQVADLLGHASPAITEGGSYIDRDRAGAADRRAALRVLDGGRR
jgi:integrase/recombinase XerC